MLPSAEQSRNLQPSIPPSRLLRSKGANFFGGIFMCRAGQDEDEDSFVVEPKFRGLPSEVGVDGLRFAILADGDHHPRDPEQVSPGLSALVLEPLR